MEELLEILEEILPGVDFQKEKNLVGDKILTSFQIVMLISEIQDRMGVELDPANILPERFQSLESIYELIEESREE